MLDRPTQPREALLPGAVAPAPASTLRPRRSRKWILLPLLGLLAAGGVAAWWRFAPPPAAATSVVAYGAIDIRQSQLAFNGNDRISRILVQEGDRVSKGQLLAELDATRLQANADKASADADVARNTLARLRNGSRPEEIDQARANLAAAQATEANNRINFDRAVRLAAVSVSSQQNSRQR